MSVNIVSLAMQYLSPELIGKISSALGLDRSMVGKAISAAIPMILGGAVDKSASPEGARQLFDVIGKQDPGLLGNLAGMLGGNNQSSLISGGSSMLSSLLGGSSLGSLVGALGKFSGLAEGGSKSLLGLLGPVAMGVLGKQVMSSKLDAGGLASMLAGQKNNIASALPAGFSNLLSDNTMSKATDAVKSTVGGAASKTAATISTAARSVESTAAKASSGFKLWPILAGLAILAGAYWWYAGGSTPSVPKILAGTVDVGSQTNNIMGTLKTALGDIKDAASVKAAVPKLEAALGQVEALDKVAGALPADGKKALAAFVSTGLPAITSLIANAQKQPEGDKLLKPILDKIVAVLSKLAKG